jgi:hypothetical protein
MSTFKKRIVHLSFFVLIIIFLYIYLKSIDYSKLSELTLNFPLLLLSTLIAISFRYWGVFIWRVILIHLGSCSLPHFSILSTTYSKAWMGRYIPGTITWIAAKIYLANALGISKSRLTVSSLLEGVVQIVALMVVSMFLLGLDSRLNVISDTIKLALICIAILCLIILNPMIFNALIRKAYLIIKKQEPGPDLKINGIATFQSFILYSIGAFLSGSSFFLLVKSVDPSISSNLYLYLVGTYNLSGAIGMATPLLPSGIGVRDGVLFVLLSIVLPGEIAVVLTILSRLWSAAVDVLFYICTVVSQQLLAA